jgi:predicted TIM-barrel fold metal-dependent hydrolase
MAYAPGLMKQFEKIAERHPGLRLIVDHFALPMGRRDEDVFSDFDALLAMARYPNVAVKASALPCYTSESYPFRGLHPYIRRAHEAFGPRRLLWGTDYSRLPCSYRQAITLFTEELGFLSGEDKEWIMGRAASEWFGWPLPGFALDTAVSRGELGIVNPESPIPNPVSGERAQRKGET